MASDKRRVVITGMGLVSPLGSNSQELWQALAAGRSGVAPLERVPATFLPTKVGGEARHFPGEIDDFGPLEKTKKRNIKKGLRVMCREIQMGVAAAQLALNDAGLSDGQAVPERSGVVYGTDYIMTRPEEFEAGIRGCLDENQEFNFSRWGEEGLVKVQPLWLLKYLPNMPASHIAIYNDFRGPSNSLTLREASANSAVGEAFQAISRGSADIMIAGATGTRIHPLRTVHALIQEQVATGDDATGLSRPFELNRNGMVMGEGAGALILEELTAAETRGATIMGEVVAATSSIAVSHRGVADFRQAVGNVLRSLLKQLELAPADLGHLHAHGLSTVRADEQEAQAIHEVLGDSVPVLAAKSYFGNLGAASGIVELISSLMSLKAGELFPILNYDEPDPKCPIRAAQAGESPGRDFINVNFTPQGQTSAVYVRSL